MADEQAAASLFSPEDSSADPFAAFGTSDAAADDFFNSVVGSQDTAEAAYAPESPSQSVQSSEGQTETSQVDWSKYQTQPSDVYSVTQTQPKAQNYAPSSYEPYPAPPAQPVMPSQPYDPYAPTNHASYTPNSHPTQTYPSSTTYSPAVPTAPNSYAPTSSYAPPVSNSYTPALASQPYATDSSNPYIPSTTSASSAYTSPAASYATQTTSDAYAPQHKSYTKPHQSASSGYPASYSTPTTYPGTPSGPPSNVGIAPPPPKPATLLRPQVSNAYDPPFPTSKANRKTASRFSQYSTPSEPAAVYSAYTQPTQPHPPTEQSQAALYPPQPSEAAPAPPALNGYPSEQRSYSPYSPSAVEGLPPTSSSFSDHTAENTRPPLARGYSSSSQTAPPVSNTPPPTHPYTDLSSEQPHSAKSNHSAYSSMSGRSYTPPVPSSRVQSPAIGYAPPRAYTPPVSGHKAVSSLPPSFPPRTASPASVYTPNEIAHNSPEVKPPPSVNEHSGPKTSPVDPYAPPRANGQALPKSRGSVSSLKYPPPSRYQASSDTARNRSMSGSSILSSNGHADPYAPSQHTSQGSEASYHAPPIPRVQELTVKTPAYTPYAPSPSLLGTNDPLGRTAARAPVFSFGFGGKFVSCFHGASTMNTGFDVALSSRQSTGITIRVLNKMIPQSALESSLIPFPGPLFQDPGTPTGGLVRTGAATQAKTKKTKVLKYLSDREDELSQAIGYLHADSTEKHQSEGKLTLLRVLKVMVENDGRLTGSPAIDAAIRNALLPRLNVGSSEDSSLLNPAMVPAFSSSAGTAAQSSTEPISVSTLRPEALDKIQEFLLRGERQKAYHYALDERLWAHAMIVASGIDKDAWKEVVNEFIKTELGVRNAPSSSLTVGEQPKPQSNGREGLRVAYSLYSGQGSGCVQELVPQSVLIQRNGLTPSNSFMTPNTPNFHTTPPAANIPVETLSNWAETALMMLSGTITSETSSALTSLGDQLVANNWVEAGHVCYLLSPQTSLLGGVGHPTARIILVGAANPQVVPSVLKDPDAIILSEVVEYALSLAPTTKGQEPFHGLPHLQAYRLIRALALIEIGDVAGANRYCEAINGSLGRASPYHTTLLLEHLKSISGRIAGVAHSDKGGWIGGKLAKPSLDTIGTFLERRFTRLVTGDADSPTPTDEDKTSDRTFSGPFSNYSTISSTVSSKSPSPQPDFNPPQRAGSAMANRTAPYTQPPIDRASSAMDYVRRRQSPGPQATSANGSTASFGQSYSYPQTSSYGDDGTEAMTPRPLDSQPDEDEGQEVTWWGSGYGASSAQTPKAAMFVPVAATDALTSNEGFVSLMDNHTPFATAPATPSRHTPTHSTSLDDDDDLGLGNSKPKPPKPEGESGDVGPKTDNAPPPARPAPQPTQGAPASSGSWLGRLWGRGSTGPVKANLGEETSFVYDKDLKRWVNKRVGETAASQPTAPTPPPRAQTASPGMMAAGNRQGIPAPPTPGAGPPPRAASAVDLGNSPPPPRNIARIRSNLVPTPEGTESAPGTPTGFNSMTPPRSGQISPNPASGPPSRPRSQATKRGVRGRYVDVFSQEAA